MPWFAALIPAMGAAGGAAAGGAAAAGTAAAGAATAGSIATIGAGTAGAALTGASATGIAAAGSGWLATAANIASLAGTVGSTLSSVLSSGQNAQAASYEAKQLQYQAREQERITRRANQKQIAIAENKAFASGSQGRIGDSPLNAILDAIGESEREALAIRYGGQVRSDAAKRQASMSKAQIPGQLFGGLAQAGGVLSKWLGK